MTLLLLSIPNGVVYNAKSLFTAALDYTLISSKIACATVKSWHKSLLAFPNSVTITRKYVQNLINHPNISLSCPPPESLWIVLAWACTRCRRRATWTWPLPRWSPPGRAGSPSGSRRCRSGGRGPSPWTCASPRPCGGSRCQVCNQSLGCV